MRVGLVARASVRPAGEDAEAAVVDLRHSGLDAHADVRRDLVDGADPHGSDRLDRARSREDVVQRAAWAERPATEAGRPRERKAGDDIGGELAHLVADR